MGVPFLDLGAATAELSAEIEAATLRVVRSGWYVLGPEVEAFEAEFAAHCGARHCVGVGSGLDALTLALRALEVGPGDEVVVPANTYIATWLAVSAVGARPVPVEPDPVTMNIDAAGVEAAVTAATRVVLPVHLYGRAAPMDELRAVCAEHGLALLEDAAQAHGAAGVGRGDLAAYSFYPSKNLGALGDGGAVTTDDDALADRLRLLRNYGSRRKYHHEMQGSNSRLDPMQAAILRVKLGHLDEWNARRRALAEEYGRGLAGLPGVVVPAPAGDDHVWHVYPVLCDDRNGVQAALSALGVETLVHYPVPPHLSGAYAGLGHGLGSFPVTERLAASLLSLPIGPQLPAAAVATVCDALAAAVARPLAA